MSGRRQPLRDLILRYRRRLGLLVVLSFLSSVAEALLLMVVVRLALVVVAGQDSIGFGSASVRVHTVAAALLGLLFLKMIVNVATAWVSADLGRVALTSYRLELLRSFFDARWEELALEREGRLQDLISTDGERAAIIPAVLANFSTAFTSFVVVVGAAMLISPFAALVASAVGAILALALSPLSAATKRSSKAGQQLRSLLSARVGETARMALEARVFGVGSAALDRLEVQHRELEGEFRRTRFNVQLMPQLYQNAILLLTVGGAWILSVVGTSEVDETGAALLLLLRAFSYGQQAQTQYQTLVVQEPSLDAIVERRNELHQEREKFGREPMPSSPDLHFESVSFSYPDGGEVLSNLNFTIAAGESVGIIGPSGAGKSTLLQLLLRLRAPTSGQYLVGEIPSVDIRSDSWHSKVAFVPQEPRLISGTVFDNIAYFRPTDRASVEAAARLAHIFDEISARRAGLDEEVGEAGSAFSGGQRQRMTIARALLKGPEVLILDEPTSSLDGDSEAGLQATLKSLRGQLTLIVVSHRMSTLAICDRILVLEGGSIEAFDRPESLIGSSPFFAKSMDHAGLILKEER